jgi:DNA-binding NtrC family response regulator
MNLSGRILFVDDDRSVLDAARIFLRRSFELFVTETDPTRIPEYIKEQGIDIILLDMNFSAGKNDGSEGLYWIRKIRNEDSSIMIIPVTAYGETELAVKAMQEGAHDFVIKPWSNQKLLATLKSALELKIARQEVVKLRSTRQKLIEDLDLPFSRMLGDSLPMKKLIQLIDKVASTDANVLVVGENGTGKELVARELHRKSARSREAFISVDLGSIHEGLFETELFGHIKGAYTDASEDRPGRFELATGGTLFLDEIGNLPVSLQPKLLSALQNRRITRVGSSREIATDIRLISATNQSLIDLVKRQLFRQDLFFRINTFEIYVPPLRERTDDIPLLLDYYLTVYAKKYNKPFFNVNRKLIKVLQQYPWPGNVREFHHAVEKAVILAEKKIITEADFNLGYRSLAEQETFSLSLSENEKRLILAALDKHRGNVSKAAIDLGIERTALHRRIKKYGF